MTILCGCFFSYCNLLLAMLLLLLHKLNYTQYMVRYDDDATICLLCNIYKLLANLCNTLYAPQHNACEIARVFVLCAENFHWRRIICRISVGICLDRLRNVFTNPVSDTTQKQHKLDAIRSSTLFTLQALC